MQHIHSKHIFLVLFVLSLCLSSFSQVKIVQRSKKRRDAPVNALKTDLVPVIVNAYSIAYEREMKRGQSLQVTIGASPGLREVYAGEFQEQETFWVTPEYRFYLSNRDQPLVGWYLAPYLKYRYINRLAPHDRIFEINQLTGSLISPGGAVGGQVLLWDRMVINGSVGMGYALLNSLKWNNKIVPLPIDFVEHRIDLRANLAIGVAF